MTNANANNNANANANANNILVCEECHCTPSAQRPRFTLWYGATCSSGAGLGLHWWCNDCLGEENGVMPELEEWERLDVRATYTLC